MESAGDDVVLKAGRKRKHALTWLHSATAEREQSKTHTHTNASVHVGSKRCLSWTLMSWTPNANLWLWTFKFILTHITRTLHGFVALTRPGRPQTPATDQSCSFLTAVPGFLPSYWYSLSTLSVLRRTLGEKKERRKKSYGGSRLTVKSHLPPGTPAKCKWRLRVALHASTIIIPTSLRVSQHSRASVREQEEARTATRREEEEANGGAGQLAGPGKLQRRFGFFVIDCVCTCVRVCVAATQTASGATYGGCSLVMRLPAAGREWHRRQTRKVPALAGVQWLQRAK